LSIRRFFGGLDRGPCVSFGDIPLGVGIDVGYDYIGYSGCRCRYYNGSCHPDCHKTSL
jgi:hypothetical protein